MVTAVLVVALQGCATGAVEQQAATIAPNAPSPMATAILSPQISSTPRIVTADQATQAETGVVATVEGEPITRAEWQQALALDQVMSQLAGRPTPGLEATLERVINERIVYRLAQAQVDETRVTARLNELQQFWGVSDAALDEALKSAGLAREQLVAEIARLLVVEDYLRQIGQKQDAANWMATQRASTRVGVYVDLTAGVAAATQSAPQTPKPTAATAGALPTATPTPAVVEVQTAAPASDAAPSGVSVGNQALDFTLQDTAGQSISLAGWRGHPVVINFWATWCPPCRQELPAFQAVYEQYKALGVVMVGIDEREDAQTVASFASQNGISYPLLMDTDGRVGAQYQANGIPTTVLVDVQGIVRARHVGPLSTEQLADLLAPLMVSPVVPTTPPTPTLAGAQRAPEFSLLRENGSTVSLRDYRDKSSVVLVFYSGQT
jgi:peroxiredoxin